MAHLLFYILAAIAVLGAACVLTIRSPIKAAIALIVSLGSLSAIYVLLNAQFVAVMQLLIYAGAIIVLFVFVIMLLNLQEPIMKPRSWLWAFALGSVIVFAACFLTRWLVGSVNYQSVVTVSPGFGSVEQVGQAVLVEYALPFEVLSLLLLVSVVGAVVLAKKRL